MARLACFVNLVAAEPPFSSYRGKNFIDTLAMKLGDVLLFYGE
jgi:hypothetical protein